MHSWHYVTVGVADLESALAQWRLFGFVDAADPYANDAEFAAVWGLSNESFGRRCCVQTQGVDTGHVHLVEFGASTPSVRAGAAAFDRCPKNLDIHVSGLPNKVSELQAAGLQLKSETVSEVTAPDGTAFRELHVHGHDDTNVVLLEVLGQSLPFNTEGFAGVGPVVTTVFDRPAEQAFYERVFKLELLNENLLEGPEIEAMVGLPSGAALDVVILGNPGEHFGRIELVEYRNTGGISLYERARAPARGILGVSYSVDSVDALSKRLLDVGVRFDSVHRRLRFESPNGFSIEAH